MSADPGFAPAKVNLALHVTGRREDCHHALDSLVVFVDVGDQVRVEPAPDLSLSVEGPFAGTVPVEGNLVLRAARALRDARGVGQGAALTLAKALPPASGIGGGSSDAAAALRLLCALWGVEGLSTGEALAIGADVPICVHRRPARMRGAGERVAPVPRLPPMALVLVHPGVGLKTRAVFAALDSPEGRRMGPVPKGLDYAAFADWLSGRTNHLARAAQGLEPRVAQALARLREAPGVDLARMSGSGATCFGLCRDQAAAARAADAIAAQEPAWWVRAAAVLR